MVIPAGAPRPGDFESDDRGGKKKGGSFLRGQQSSDPFQIQDQLTDSGPWAIYPWHSRRFEWAYAEI
jgi:hypothetical protein